MGQLNLHIAVNMYSDLNNQVTDPDYCEEREDQCLGKKVTQMAYF